MNWLLVRAFEFDLVAAISGGQTAAVSRLVYIVVGLCAIWQLIRLGALFEDRSVIVTRDRTPGP